MKDIFVEVDWMKKEIEGRWYADGSGGKYYVPGFTIEYRMKEGAQNTDAWVGGKEIYRINKKCLKK